MTHKSLHIWSIFEKDDFEKNQQTTKKNEENLLSMQKVKHTNCMVNLGLNVGDWTFAIYRGSYMSAHVLLNLLNKLGKRDKMRGLPSILSLFRNEFNKFNNTRARMLDSI